MAMVIGRTITKGIIFERIITEGLTVLETNRKMQAGRPEQNNC
jgi:hypothetical protein